MSLPKLEPTPEQRIRLAEIRKQFGAAVHKTYKIHRSTGIMEVRLNSAAGQWRWSFDTKGNMRHASMDMMMTLEGINDDSPRSGALPD